MYLDTKNLSLADSNMSAAMLERTKSRGRMPKVWKPLLRFLSTKGANGANKCLQLNNVDLNNTQQQQQKQLDISSMPDSTSIKAIDSCNESISKNERIPLSAEIVHAESENTNPTYPTVSAASSDALISSVYIEKSTSQHCNRCQYGRNCQHSHEHSNNNSQQQQQQQVLGHSGVEELSMIEALNLPLQYYSTDSGIFYWAHHTLPAPQTSCSDEELLQAWLCQQLGQLPGTLC